MSQPQAKTTKKNNRTYYILGGVVLALLIAAAIYKSRTSQHGEKVTTEKVARRTIHETVAASGKVFPVTEVNISSDVSGEVVELYVEEGDSVVVGQVLARIDPDAYLSQVERGEATVNSARAQAANARAQVENLHAQREQILAQLDNARKVHERNKKLHAEGVISDADLETSLTNLEALEANLRSVEASIRAAEESARAAEYQVKSAEATLKELKTSLRRTTIYAPMSGIVSRLNVEKGERVVGTIQMAGTEIMRIADLSDMEVQVEVSENDLPRVSLGDFVEIEVDAYVDRKFTGKVTEIAHSANNLVTSATGNVSLTSDQVTNFVVTISLDPASYADLVRPENPYPFRPGMSASVEIFTETVEDALSVPIQAVTTRERNKVPDLKNDTTARALPVSSGTAVLRDDELVEVVFLVKGDTVDMVPVKTGVQDDTYIQIVEGNLAEGDLVVTGPYATVARKLKEGDEVTVETKNDKKKGEEEEEE
ncbi:MAG: HlyD family efflux transporter periplasmic adaptor subunit [Bacteroidetes bacterium]|nr:MAG: HlyD family efflux transporter periplasmic adaptor subunit [Bacteroidota bacterium]